MLAGSLDARFMAELTKSCAFFCQRGEGGPEPNDYS
jgi:hypothetical protein